MSTQWAETCVCGGSVSVVLDGVEARARLRAWQHKHERHRPADSANKLAPLGDDKEHKDG